MYNLEFKYGTSRAKDTYGYTIVSLYVNGVKVASCNGGGYDMFGTVLGDWVTKQFNDQLKKLNLKTYYGLFHYDKTTNERVSKSTKNTTTFCDGGCGDSSCRMQRILEAIGYKLVFVKKNAYRVVKDE